MQVHQPPLLSLPPNPTTTPAPVRPEPRSSASRVILRAGRFFKNWLLAAFTCLSIPSAVIFAGWTFRLVQRQAKSSWAKRLGLTPARGRTFPRWIIADDLRGHFRRTSALSLRAWIHAAFASLWPNLTTGLRTVCNAMLLTLPGGMIMMFSWYAGWDNSFNKGYEQAAVGPLWGFAGIFLFMAAMTYVPIAQGRQAVTGSAKSFWNFRKVRDVIRRRPLACLFLLASYTLLGAVFMIAVSALMFIGNEGGFAEMSAPEAIQFLNRYYFGWAALFIVPSFVGLKLWAGRIYATAAWEAVASGAWSKQDLVGEEALLSQVPVDAGPPVVPGLRRMSGKTISWLGRTALRVVAFALLFLFAAELYVAQFFNFEPAANWLRQPMVQLPWYHSIPRHLRE